MLGGVWLGEMAAALEGSKLSIILQTHSSSGAESPLLLSTHFIQLPIMLSFKRSTEEGCGENLN